jgi:hypothetical protein
MVACYGSAAPQEELAQQALKAMTRKFSGSAKAWLAAYGHAVQAGDGEGARKTLDRALAALPPRKHIKARAAAAASPFPGRLALSPACRACCFPLPGASSLSFDIHAEPCVQSALLSVAGRHRLSPSLCMVQSCPTAIPCRLNLQYYMQGRLRTTSGAGSGQRSTWAQS